MLSAFGLCGTSFRAVVYKPRPAGLMFAAREYSGTKLCFPYQNAGQLLSDLVNFASRVIFGKYHVRCNGIRTCISRASIVGWTPYTGRTEKNREW